VSETTPAVEARPSLQKSGLKLLTALYASLQAVRLYPLENETVQSTIDQLHATATQLLDEEGSLEIRTVSGGFLFNLTRVRLSVAGHAVLGAFERCLANHEIDSITIHAGVAREEWPPFLGQLLMRPPAEDRFAAFVAALRASHADHLVVSRRAAGTTTEQEVQGAARVFSRSVQVAREVLDGIRIGRAVNARKVKRSVQGIVDQVLNNQVAMLGMTALRDFDEYTFTHSVNVCILSVVLGQRLGLEKKQLYELGLCGLLHDIGKARIDSAIINKPGALTEEEWHQMRLHPREGLLALFQLRGFAALPLRQMLAAYEHHMKVDLSGYPAVRRTRRPSLFTHIVSVVDTFDAVSSQRSYRSRGWPPDKVLLNMRDEPGWGLDRVLVKAFITVTGIYPVGTVVSLSDGSLAIVVAPNVDSPDAPAVQLITDASGKALAEPRRLDLAEARAAGGATALHIRSSLDPAA
jgi:HD-GYP domain-containing protein (c-di-GMP phosphodiesterase class II)